jgi:hypothetical protein
LGRRLSAKLMRADLGVGFWKNALRDGEFGSRKLGASVPDETNILLRFDLKDPFMGVFCTGNSSWDFRRSGDFIVFSTFLAYSSEPNPLSLLS